MTPPPVVYRIDRDDKLRYVSPSWDAFALENWGDNHLSHRVLGQSLWDLMSDLTVRSIYYPIVKLARAGRHVSFRFRCDSMHMQRFMLMDVRAQGELVEFVSYTLETRPCARCAIPQAERVAKPGDAAVRLCSWCSRAAGPDGQWRPLDEALSDGTWFSVTPFPKVTHTICEPCAERMLKLVREGGTEATGDAT